MSKWATFWILFIGWAAVSLIMGYTGFLNSNLTDEIKQVFAVFAFGLLLTWQIEQK